MDKTCELFCGFGTITDEGESKKSFFEFTKFCNKNKIYRFGQFVLQSDGVLQYKGNAIKIPQKEFLVFTLLLDNFGRLVSRKSLLDFAWNNEAVAENELLNCIYDIRQLLGQDKKNRFIETVSRKGYRFCLSVSVV